MPSKKQPEFVETTFYAQVRPEWATWKFDVDEGGHPILEGCKVQQITQKRPRRPAPGVVLVKLTLRIPASGFLPLRPEAIVVVPEGMTEAITVLACDIDPAEEVSDDEADELVVP